METDRRRQAAKVWAHFADLVWPRNCIGCGGAAQAGPLRWLCKACEKQLHRVRPPACKTCGFPFFGVVVAEHTCPHCTDLDPVFEEGRTMLLHRDAGRAYIHGIKYGRQRFLLNDIAIMARQDGNLAAWLEGSTLVPVPLYPRRERERGFNQAFLLAQALARVTPGARVDDRLRRVRETATQTRLTRAQREANVRGAFALVGDAKLSPEAVYTLIDDVFTTGATFNACAKVLHRHGARKIRVLSLAHG